MQTLINLFLHLDTHLTTLIHSVGIWTYLILFLIILVETGSVIFPFLPGDSLLFAAGALAAINNAPLNFWLLIIIFIAAAVSGDSLSFLIGKNLGTKFLQQKLVKRIIKPQDIQNAHNFFNKHGNKAIFFGRFLPIIRTFVPFIVATTNYPYKKFFTYNVIAASAWSIICCSAGYFLGNIPIIKEHFSLIIIIILLISFLPFVIKIIKDKFKING